MSIFSENYSKYLTEMKSEAKQDLKNRSADYDRYKKRGKSGYKKYFYNGSYDDLNKEIEAVKKPMRTAEDYKRREKFYSDSNKIQSQEEDIAKKRKFAKRPILGSVDRKINRKLDEEYRDENNGYGRLTGKHYYDKSNFHSAHKRKNLKEACEYILSILDESEYIDDDYDFEDID